MKKVTPLLFAVLLIVVCRNANANQLIDTNKIKTNVTLFAPGEIPGTAKGYAAPAFSPDGRSVYFGQSDGKGINIVVSYKKDGKWTTPIAAPFSGDFPNLEPAFAPNSKYIVFASSRPITDGGKNIDGSWSKQSYPGKGGNLWKVELTKKGWGTPTRLPDVINQNTSTFSPAQNTSTFSPAVTGDGSIYFMKPDTSGRFHTFRSQYRNGKYEDATPSSFSLPGYGDVDPAVAPDESFLVFSSGRPPALSHTADLFIVFRTPNGWSEPIDLRVALASDKVFGVEARLSPDLKILYFCNQRNAAGVTMPTEQYIWQVDISKVLKEHGIK
jgi:Tol biopolymer transport system component